MPRQPAPKRTQFSSCDACRLSRVACDASKGGSRPHGLGSNDSCSRCRRRKESCTFEWMKHTKARAFSTSQTESESTQAGPLEDEHSAEAHISSPADANLTKNNHGRNGRREHESAKTQSTPCTTKASQRRPSISSSTEPSAKAGTARRSDGRSPLSQSQEDLLMLLANRVFCQGFETTFGTLLGRYGCPFVDDPHSDIVVPVSILVRTLDAKTWKDRRTQLSLGIPQSDLVSLATDDLIEQCLDRAILAFTARWLPLNPSTLDPDALATSSWRSSRSDMLMLLNRVSYRSVLALSLFAQTPVPADVGEDEELGGVSAPICMNTALMHVQKLRQQCNPARKFAPSVAQVAVGVENRVYWAAISWDVVDALSSDMRTSLTSGLNGACAEPAWRLTRAFLFGSFMPATKIWLADGFEVDNDSASRVIGAASVCHVYTWKLVTSLKEALREGVDEAMVLYVWESLLESLTLFRRSIRPLLTLCEKHIHFLSQENRFGWFETCLNYCVGMMVLFEMLEVARRPHFVQQLVEVREEVEHEAFAILKFGTESAFRIVRCDQNLALDSTSLIPAGPIDIAFVGLYVFPHHLVTLTQLLCGIILQRRQESALSEGVFAHLSSILVAVLEKLPDSSKIVRSGRRDLQAMMEGIM